MTDAQDMTTPASEETAAPAPEVSVTEGLPRLPRPAPRKRRRGDRSDGRLVRTAIPMTKMMAFIMTERSDGCNTYADEFDVTEADELCREMVKKGYTSFSFLHVMLAAYVRTVSQRPIINRFISGQRIYARNCIEVNMVIKKEMTVSSPDTAIKVHFEPDDTIEEIYEKFNKVVEEVKNASGLDSEFDNTAAKIASLPRPILRTAIKVLNWLDYHGWMPKWFLKVSPFHGSMIITSMGSLGIKPIYHHLYNFGNLPVFFAYGTKRTVTRVKRDGSLDTRRIIDVKAVTDERICDGFSYASAFKLMKRYVEHPRLLTVRPDAIYEDID